MGLLSVNVCNILPEIRALAPSSEVPDGVGADCCGWPFREDAAPVKRRSPPFRQPSGPVSISSAGPAPGPGFLTAGGGCPLERCHFVLGTPAIFPGDFYRFGHRPPGVSPAWKVVQTFRRPHAPPTPPPVVKEFRHEIGVEHVRFIPGPFWGPFPVSKRPLDEVRETWWKVKNG